MYRNKQFAVLGLGGFGQAIVKTLFENGADVLACDISPDVVHETSRFATHVVQADISDYSALEELELGNFDVVIIGTSENLEVSILATIFLKESGCKYVIVKAANPVHKNILEKIGADKVVLPEKEMGEKLALSLIGSNIIEMIGLSDKYSIVEIFPLDKWINHSIIETDIRAKHKISILAIKRDKDIIVSPSPQEIILEQDIIVVIGEIESINNLTS